MLSLWLGDAEFRVMPEANPTERENTNHQNVFTLPEGWRPATQEDPDFDFFRTRVIGGYPCDTHVVLVAKTLELDASSEPGEFDVTAKGLLFSHQKVSSWEPPHSDSYHSKIDTNDIQTPEDSKC